MKAGPVALVVAGALLLPSGATGQQEPPPIQAGVAPAPGPYAPGIDVLHYDVEIGLGLGSDRVEGDVTIRVAVEENAPTLPLDFTGLAVHEVTVDGASVRADHVDGVLRVPLGGAAAGDEVAVRVRYGGVPDDGLILRDNVHGDPAAFVDNWPNRTRFWLPTVDHPADKATVRFTVHAPAAWRVIANGRLVTEGAVTPPDALGPAGDRLSWVWEVGVPISTYNMVIGAADMVVTPVGLAACGQAPMSPRDDGCIEVTTWLFPESVESGSPSFRRAAEMVDYFTETFGPFPFEKLANVQSATRFGGMENASAIFYSEQALAAGQDMEGTVSHEIAHQWFGDAVTEASWHHLWLSEGFATYFGDQFFEVADGVERFRALMEESRTAVVQSEVSDRPIYDPEVRDLFALLNSNSYPKGGWVLHMLRGVVGDEAFFAGVRDYYERHLHSAVWTSHFQAALESSSGQDLDWFFRQWIYEPGFPVFDQASSWSADADGGTLTLTVRQLQKDAWPAFRVPMEVLVEQDGVEHRVDVVVDGRESVLRIPLPGATAPSRVVLDPDGWVLKVVR